MTTPLDRAYLDEFGFTFNAVDIVSAVETFGITDPKEIRDSLGMGKREFNKAIRELAEKGWELP